MLNANNKKMSKVNKKILKAINKKMFKVNKK